MSTAAVARQAIASLIADNYALACQVDELAVALQAALGHITQQDRDLAVYRAATRARAAQERREALQLRVVPGRRIAGGA